MKVKNYEVLVSGQIDGLKKMVEMENPTATQVAQMKEKHHWITNSLVEHLNELYVRWGAADADKVTEIQSQMKDRVGKFVGDLNDAERNILMKTPPEVTPLLSPTLSNFSSPPHRRIISSGFIIREIWSC